MVAPKPISLTQVDAGDYQGPEPKPYAVVGPVPGTGGPLADAEPSAYVEIDAEPADADAVAADLTALRDALVAAGLMEAE